MILAMSQSAEQAKEILRAADIDTFYGASHILRKVTFRVRRGETVSLLGRNGMGKTTLLRTLMGLVKPKRGTIVINEADMTAARASAIARAGVGFVPEGRGIFPNLTVAENLVFAERRGSGGGSDWTQAQVYDLFPRLAERRHHWGNQLSGGEQQMLSIGRALLGNPDIMLIDEATEGLAPKIRDVIWETLRMIAQKSVAIVVVDKNLDDLVALCERHVVLNKGEIVFEGTSDALRADPERLTRWLGV
jgi:branched-chain amino acid transport system ATP-binding protein